VHGNAIPVAVYAGEQTVYFVLRFLQHPV